MVSWYAQLFLVPRIIICIYFIFNILLDFGASFIVDNKMFLYVHSIIFDLSDSFLNWIILFDFYRNEPVWRDRIV